MNIHIHTHTQIWSFYDYPARRLTLRDECQDWLALCQHTVTGSDSKFDLKLLRGAHFMFCNDDITTLFLQHTIDQFRITSDKNILLDSVQPCFVPCDEVSGKGVRSSASIVDLSRSDFRATMHYDYCQGKHFQECFQSLKHALFWRSISVQSHCFQLVQTIRVWSENVGRR